MNRYSYFFSNVLFFFGELAVLKCFGPQLWGNLMDVQKPHGAENSIKICFLCFDTKFGLWWRKTCLLQWRGGQLFWPRWRETASKHLPQRRSYNQWGTFCSQETSELIYDPVAQFVAWCWKLCSFALTEACALPPSGFGLWIELSNQIHNWDVMYMEKDSKTHAHSLAADRHPNHLFLDGG